jgi:predicted alpha/beta superfamily hydrolase
MKRIEEYLLYSDIVEDEFTITVSYPTRYDETLAYPVVFALDSNIYFGLVSDTVRLMQFGNELPQMFVIGIGYPDNDQHIHLRERDYLPEPAKSIKHSGFAEQFHQFLDRELIPDLRAKYKLSDDFTLLGDSYSGLFALYSLFTRPNFFKRYVVGSPSIYFNDRVILDYEKTLSERGVEVNGNVFLSVGQLEATTEPDFANMVGNVMKLSDILNARSYNLNITTHIFDNETHLSVIPATFSRGLREVFKDN